MTRRRWWWVGFLMIAGAVGACSGGDHAHEPHDNAGCFLLSEVEPLKLPQLKTLNLPGGGLRQFRDEFNPAWILIRRNFRFHKILQFCRQSG
jgi:hypothetical protein